MSVSARLTVAADAAAAPAASEWARALGARLGLGESDLYRLDLCVTELVTNVASYAYDDPSGVIELNAHAAPEGGELRVEIIDSGRSESSGSNGRPLSMISTRSSPPSGAACALSSMTPLGSS